MRIERALMSERVVHVFALLDKVIEALPVHSYHREVLQAHLRKERELAAAQPEMSAIQMPLLVHEAITGDERAALPVAAACTFLFLGAGLYDSILDDELPSYWRTYDSAEVNLAATTLLAALPQLSIALLQEEGTAPAKLWALVCLFADTVLELNTGQHEDVLFSNLENVSLEDSRVMAERKSGSAGALLAKAGAVLATEDPRTIEAYAAFGSCFGTAKQLIDDVWDIWGEDTSRDLLNGKRTLPIVHALSTLQGEQRERLQKLLAAARESPKHHDEVRALLAAAGSVRYTALIVWLYQQQAQNHLDAASPQGLAGREIRMMLDEVSLLPQPQAARTSAYQNEN
jgi:geranylgeranyl diphosphate synthase, type I